MYNVELDKDDAFWYMQAVAAVLMWLKFTNFLRAFSATGYLIRMIYEVITDMIAFMIVLALSCVALADAYFSVTNAEREEGALSFAKFQNAFKFMYLQTLGEFYAPDEMGMEDWSPALWILFFISSMVNLIVMLNLLIAVISETYSRVNEKKNEYDYKEKIALVDDINLYIGWYLKLKQRRSSEKLERQKLLFIVDEK